MLLRPPDFDRDRHARPFGSVSAYDNGRRCLADARLIGNVDAHVTVDALAGGENDVRRAGDRRFPGNRHTYDEVEGVIGIPGVSDARPKRDRAPSTRAVAEPSTRDLDLFAFRNDEIERHANVGHAFRRERHVRNGQPAGGCAARNPDGDENGPCAHGIDDTVTRAEDGGGACGLDIVRDATSGRKPGRQLDLDDLKAARRAGGRHGR